MKRLPIELPEKLYNGLEHFARKQDICMKSLLVEALLEKNGIECYRSWKHKGMKAVRTIAEMAEKMEGHLELQMLVQQVKKAKQEREYAEFDKMVKGV